MAEPELPPGPRDHVLRAALPWRTDKRRTECGKDAEAVPTITRDQLVERTRKLGQQRASLFTCMTCWNTAARRPGAWAENPVAVMDRECDPYPPDPRLRDELLAVAALIDAHRDEFDELLAGLSATVRLADRRRRGGAR